MSLNLFFRDFELIPAGIFGFDIIYSIKTGTSLAFTIFIINVFFLILGDLTLPKKEIEKAMVSSLLVPLFTYLTSDLGKIIDISSAEFLLITIFGAFLIGYGNGFIYKECSYVGATDIIERITEAIIGRKGRYISYFIDAILLIFTALNFGIERSMYALIAVTIIEYMNKKNIIGISDSKVFYIITKEENKVKKFILDELHYDLTIFDVKGGFSKTKSRVLMSAIDTKDYYKLREGIKNIDKTAFITITDSYEIINQNNALNNL